jgi:16S rRNA A1518/A1519 N6-dimethyltransferase RsmA/KsgA/DIM1 with predicted DNA glycosylase/AP lyase activity
LSVESALRFRIHKIMDVQAGNFFPKPKVDSSIIYLVPKNNNIGKREDTILRLLMEHSSKKIRNALADSASELGMDKAELRRISDMIGTERRPFQMSPEELLDTARDISERISSVLKV